jgi:hypothetical protein
VAIVLIAARKLIPEQAKCLGVVVRDYIRGGSETIIFYLNVPRHCPLVLLIRARLSTG